MLFSSIFLPIAKSTVENKVELILLS